MSRRLLSFLLCLTLPALSALAQQAPAPAEEPQAAGAPAMPPATPEGAVPPQVIQNLEQLLQPPDQPMPLPQLRQLRIDRSRRVIELGRQARRQYPSAANLWRVDVLMFEAALPLAARLDRTPETLNQLIEVAQTLKDSAAPPAERLKADFILMRRQLADETTATQPAAQTDRQIRQFVQRYNRTDAQGAATAYGAMMAASFGDRCQPLLSELIGQLETRFIDQPEARAALRQLGRHPDIGQPFVAELTRLDGGTLTLPTDLLGKVVVVDFWATWCAPCVASLPELREIYAKYRDQGLEVVSISLDEKREPLDQFLGEHDMPWIHAFSGREWMDPTAQLYGIDAIPNVWVVGRDGLVVSDNARADLEATIQKALAAPSRFRQTGQAVVPGRQAPAPSSAPPPQGCRGLALRASHGPAWHRLERIALASSVAWPSRPCVAGPSWPCQPRARRPWDARARCPCHATAQCNPL